jgi:hypothetical protein
MMSKKDESTTELALPDVLREHRDEILDALKVHVPLVWDDEQSFMAAEQPAKLGAVLVEAIHDTLGKARIGYLFKEKMKAGGDRVKLGHAERVGAKLEYFANVDFLIVINWQTWLVLPDFAKIALIDHELCHCTIDVTDKGDEIPTLVHHDVEEFGAVVSRWGLWKRDVALFARILKKAPAPQIDFFTENGQ